MKPGGCMWSRREFLKATGGVAAAIAACSLRSREGIAAVGKTADVSVVSGGVPAENARKAVALLGGMGAFVSRGDVVVLKPNIGWDRTPEQAANTDPAFVVEVAQMCLEAGAKSVRVFDRTCNEPRRCYVNSGIQEAVEALTQPRP